MKILRSPIIYYGGKGVLVYKLLNFIPEHKIYCEVFGGGASLLFAKRPSETDIYNDIDKELFNLFQVLKDKKKFEEFKRLVDLTLYARAEHQYCKRNYKKEKNKVKRAWMFYIMLRQSFSGLPNIGWSYCVNAARKNATVSVHRYWAGVNMLPQIHQRLLNVQIDCDDFRNVIPRYDTEKTFFYCDPPYLPQTRSSRSVYRHEMTFEEHEELIELLLKVKGKVMLSGYKNDLYKKLEDNGWIRVDIETSCFTAGRTRISGVLGEGSAKEKYKRVESIWMNYDLTIFSDDYKTLPAEMSKSEDGIRLELF